MQTAILAPCTRVASGGKRELALCTWSTSESAPSQRRAPFLSAGKCCTRRREPNLETKKRHSESKRRALPLGELPASTRTNDLVGPAKISPPFLLPSRSSSHPPVRPQPYERSLLNERGVIAARREEERPRRRPGKRWDTRPPGAVRRSRKVGSKAPK